MTIRAIFCNLPNEIHVAGLVSTEIKRFDINDHSYISDYLFPGSNDINYPSQKAVKTYIDNELSAKEDVSNKSTDTNLGTSDTLYPTQNAVKQYVDTHAGGGSKIMGIWYAGDTDYFETNIAPLNLLTGVNVTKLKVNVYGDTTEVFNNTEVYVPNDWTASDTIYVDFYVKPSTAAANDVIMRINIGTAAGDGESDDVAYTPHISSAVTMHATDNKILKKVTISDTLTNLGFVAGKFNNLKFSRAVDQAGDTLSGNMYLKACVIRRG